MTCRELEVQLGKPLSREAQEHLRTCESCKAIAQWFDGGDAPAPALPSIPVEDLKPVRPLPSPWLIAAGLVAVGGLIVLAGSRHTGLAGWDALASSQRLAIFAGLAIIGAATSLLLARQMFPTLARRLPAAVCVAAALAAMVVGPVALLPWEYEVEGFTEFGIHCAEYGLLYAAAALALTWTIIRRGYFLQPAWAGALAGLVSGMVGLVVLEVYCPLIERSHVLTWHSSVVLFAVLLSSIIAHLAARSRA